MGRSAISCVVMMLVGIGSAVAAESGPKPLAEHPGNIFVAAETVVVSAAGQQRAYSLIDYEGKFVRSGQVEGGKIDLGKLEVGYYELKVGDGARVTVGVIRPLVAKTPRTSPIGIDIAMAWFYKEKEMPAVANLVTLAGGNWVRDRLSWGEIEPSKGNFRPNTRYDASARIQSAAGLRILQVAHDAPAWTKAEPKRFPPDLRDAYAFWKEMAKRWKGQVEAFEPWNEADIVQFGGHSGAEMAAMQKASYLGLKAGNPDLIAAQNVFAINRPTTLEDFAANEAWPYFDTCDLHHYTSIDKYPLWYASFRAICAGRPLWVSEFSMPVQWSGDAEAKEPSDADLRTQAERVPMVMAASLSEGVQAAFYFMFPHYVEGKTQFGIVHRDLTPRPAYLAFAAVGRFLADAKPIGRDIGGDLSAYAFEARPDANHRAVVVMWSKNEQEVELGEGEAFDHLGRKISVVDGKLKVKRPVFVVKSNESVGKFGPVPKMPPRTESRPSPIVMQAWLPVKRLDLNTSAYRISTGNQETIPVFLYNFGQKAAKGTLRVAGPEAWKVAIPGDIKIAPGERKELALSVDSGGAGKGAVNTIRMDGDFGEAGKAVVSIKVLGDQK